VVYACNPRYSGGRDQEDRSSKSAQAKSSVRPYLEKPLTEGLVEWLKVKGLNRKTKKKKKSLRSEEFITEPK
jgi:hypothetical protein